MEIDRNNILPMVLIRDVTRLVETVKHVINEAKNKYPEEKFDEFVEETYHRLKKYVKLVENMVKVAKEIGREDIVLDIISRWHLSLDDALLLKLVSSAIPEYRRHVINILYSKLEQSGAKITLDDLMKALKPIWNSVDEAIKDVDERLRKYREEMKE